MSKTAIVIGATGVVGRAVVNQLAISDVYTKIVTLTRSQALHASDKVENHIVDFDQLEHYAELFGGDALFSCLGTTLKQAGSVDAQRSVDFAYQLHAAELAVRQGVNHYLLVSSSGANSASRSAYLKMKGELEQRVKHLPFNRISIFQPSLLIGERKDQRLGEDIGRMILPVLCKLPLLKRYRPIRGDQVAAKMIRVSLQPGPPLEFFTLDAIFA